MKTLITALVFFFTLLSLLVFAQQPATAKKECVSGNCIDGKGKAVYPNGDSYDGDFANSIPQGLGKYSFANGNYYTGELILGKFDGDGKMYGSTGNILQKGFWENNKLYYDTEPKYSAQNSTQLDLAESQKFECISGNCSDGRGKAILSNGNQYKGKFKDNTMNGTGTITDKNSKIIYIGDFVQGKLAGKGKLNFVNGDFYEGDFLNGQYNGGGIYRFPDNSFFRGKWIDDKLEQNGNYFYANGDYYVGNFKNGEFEGEGSIYKKNGGLIITGFWSKNKRVSRQNPNLSQQEIDDLSTKRLEDKSLELISATQISNSRRLGEIQKLKTMYEIKEVVGYMIKDQKYMLNQIEFHVTLQTYSAKTKSILREAIIREKEVLETYQEIMNRINNGQYNIN